jgi:hypothetical protein
VTPLGRSARVLVKTDSGAIAPSDPLVLRVFLCGLTLSVAGFLQRGLA